MKILIISPPRCGSTSLLDNISALANCEKMFEPYRNNISDGIFENEYPLLLPQNCVVKMIPYQVPKKYGKPSDFFNFILSIYKEYDKIILLNRKNLQDHFESFVNLRIRMDKKLNVYVPWFKEDIEKKIIEYNIEQLKPYRNIIDEISNELKIPIIYYEDLYGENRTKSLEIIKSWNLGIDNNKLNELLHPKFKYRKSGKKNII
jgi:hypothetical protein